MALSTKTLGYLEKHCGGFPAGKTAVVTGATGGIGLKTAEILLRMGAGVILACRNTEKAGKVREQFLAEFPGASVEIMELDLADLHSVRAFAEALPEADVFINNAGVYHHPGEKTADGFQLVMGTNYLGVYELSELLIPKMLTWDREVTYINTVSIAQWAAAVHLDHFQDDRWSYPRSKLCLARYTTELARRCAGTNIHVYMSHPGIAVTGIAAHAYRRLYRLEKLSPFNRPEKSALAAAWILTHEVPEGSVVGPRGFLYAWGTPGINRPCRKAEREIEPLMEYTEKLLEGKEFGIAEKRESVI